MAATLTERVTVLAPVGIAPLLTTAQLQARYGVSDWTVRQWVMQGLPTVRLRGIRGVRYDLAAVEAWMAEPFANAA